MNCAYCDRASQSDYCSQGCKDADREATRDELANCPLCRPESLCRIHADLELDEDD